MTIRRARSEDFAEIAQLHLAVRVACLPFLVEVHTSDEVVRHFEELVALRCETWVSRGETWVSRGETLDGFVSIRPGVIDHLYVAESAQRRGIGTALLRAALTDGMPRRLWTFQRNIAANAFYLSRGCQPVEHTSGETNEEREPDTLYAWPGATDSELTLRVPSPDLLVDFVAALNAGWSPSTQRDIRAETLEELRRDHAAFLAALNGGEGTVIQADGSRTPRLPGRVFWLWDGAFCGSINLRHVPDQEALPAHISGHIGYSVVPWKRRRGHATRALAAILPHARAAGLRRLLVTCDRSNVGSRRVIERNGGTFAGDAPPDKLTYWIDTDGSGGIRKDAPGR